MVWLICVLRMCGVLSQTVVFVLMRLTGISRRQDFSYLIYFIKSLIKRHTASIIRTEVFPIIVMTKCYFVNFTCSHTLCKTPDHRLLLIFNFSHYYQRQYTRCSRSQLRENERSFKFLIQTVLFSPATIAFEVYYS